MNKPTITYKKILLTHDGSELATVAVAHAAALAKMFDAEIILLNVIDTLILNAPSVSADGPVLSTNAIIAEDVAKKEKANARKNLRKIKDALITQGISKVKIEVLDGIAVETIIAFIRNNAIDVVVMSTHGRSGFKRAILGSVADEIVRNAGIPVFLIHPLVT